MLGGSSSLNAQVLVIPSKSDLNAWEDIGNTGWNWHSMEPYLNGFYTLVKPDDETRDRLGLGWSKESWSKEEDSKSLHGPVKTSFTDVQGEEVPSAAWPKAIERLGYPLKGSPFSGVSIGGYHAASTIDLATQSRVSSSVAYYQPIKTRKNLQVMTACLVEKLNVEKNEAGEVTVNGVTYIHEGDQKTVVASKEVILSAGVFQSPKILELSGIGDPDILAKHSIEAVVPNVFVGSNLQDHIMHSVSFETLGSFVTRDDLLRRNPTVLQAAMTDYKTNQSGPFCSSAVTDIAYLPTDDFVHDHAARDEFLSKLAKAGIKHPLDEHRIKFLERLIKEGSEGTAQYFPFVAQASIAGDALQEGSFITIVSALSHPLSSGTSHIVSTDPKAHPKIDHEYLSHPLDVELQARHVRYSEKIAAAEPMSVLLKPDGRRNNPATKFSGSLEKAEHYIKNAGSSNYHSVGTCAMAPKESGGVVDVELKVYGVNNLRVVDASVIPLVPQSNTQSLVYALAERAAEIIGRSY